MSRRVRTRTKTPGRLTTGTLALMLSGMIASGCDSSDTNQPTPPAVEITEPTDGQWLDGSTPFQIRASASESSGIESVRFSVDGLAVDEDRTSPFEIRWDPSARADNEVHVIAATAVDTEGDEATAEISVGLHTLLDTWVIVAVQDENGDQTATFPGSSTVAFVFSETGTFSVTISDSGGSQSFSGSYKATSGGAGSSLTMEFEGQSSTTPWEAIYTWADARVVIEGSADDLNTVLGTTLVGVAQITLETIGTLD